MIRFRRLIFVAAATAGVTLGTSAAPELEPGLLGEYFETLEPLTEIPSFRGKKPAMVRVSETIDFPAGGGAFPGMKITDRFHVRWTGKIKTPTRATYTFHLGADDGARLYIYDRLVVDNDGLHPFEEKSGEVELTPGYHDIRIEYFENGVFGGCQLFWEDVTKRIVPAEALFHEKRAIETMRRKPGLLGEFYARKTTKLADLELTNAPVFVRIDPVLDFAAPDDFDAGKRFEHMVVRWTGRIHVAEPGEYTFFLESDDGSILTIDEDTVIDRDGLHSPSEDSGRKELTAGEHDIRVDYFQAGTNARLILRWEKPNGVKEVIPLDVLSH